MNTEQEKQLIVVELENARIWGAFLIPSIALDLTLLFTNKFFTDNQLARMLLGSLVLMWLLFVFYKRNDHINRAMDHIEKLK